MAESVPPTPTKRPWYLVFALSLAFFVGATSTMQGCQMFAVYQGALTSDPIVESIQTETGRKLVEESFNHYAEVLYAAKERVFPLSVGSWVLGIAVMAFAMRALSGQKIARGYLVQVLSVLTLLMVVEFFLTRDVSAAEVNRAISRQKALFPVDPSAPPLPFDQARFFAVLLFVWLGVKVLAILAVLIALMHSRTKAFYDSISLSERGSSQ